MSGIHSFDLSNESDSVTTEERRDRPPEKQENVFNDDGSFLQIFKPVHQENNPDKLALAGGSLPVEASTLPSMEALAVPSTSQPSPSTSRVVAGEKVTKRKSLMSFVGKQRGGKVLPTGVVKKQKKLDHVNEGLKDSWSKYMEEVRKYRRNSCDEDTKKIPLLK